MSKAWEMSKAQNKSVSFEEVGEDEKGAYFNEIIDFLNPFLTDLMEQKIDNKKGGMQTVIDRLRQYMKQRAAEKQVIIKLCY